MADPKKPEISLQRRAIVAGALAATSQLIIPIPSFASTKRPASTGGESMDIQRFVEDCLAANREKDAQAAVSEVLAKAVSEPNKVLAAVGEPVRAGLTVFLKSPELTIFAASWTPQMNLMPHNHLMWASIGIYTGREDNIFWKRTPDGIKAHRAEALFQKDTALLPDDAVHSVTNPLLRFTGGIHIYGGDFFGTTRSQWNPETLEEEPSDGAVIRRMFERENERLGIVGES
jgi:predicted metal-dependent enzyme (double-stranded beta helix superfamily)